MLSNASILITRSKDSKKVDENFTYCSDNNTQWMSFEFLQKWIAQNLEKVGRI